MSQRGESTLGLLAFDVGNTSVKCAAFVNGRWERLFRADTRPVEQLPERLRQGLPADRAALFAGGRCIASSVCPPADALVAEFWEAIGGTGSVEFFGTDLPVPIPAKVDEPDKVGVDRLLLAVGARELGGASCIVVSAGTAITVDLVDAEGAFAGGAIAPGFGAAARALHNQTALLPLVEPQRPASAVGTNTPEAVGSGVYWFCAGGVLALIAQYRKRPGSEGAEIICTGSDAELLLPAMAEAGATHAPNLIFEGMAAALRILAAERHVHEEAHGEGQP